MKNPFKKQSIIDTVTNVGIGGAANVAIDYAVSQIGALASVEPMYVNIGKIAVGAIGGSMIKGKIARAAFDGVATVGAANLISSLIGGSDAETTAGLTRNGTISGRPVLGNRRYVRAKQAGIGAAANAFMGK